jgi:hypothetical protein
MQVTEMAQKHKTSYSKSTPSILLYVGITYKLRKILETLFMWALGWDHTKVGEITGL